MHEDSDRNHGPQPFDALMEHWRVTNHALVESSSEQLNHKQVQKARKGRQLTLHMKLKLTSAFNEHLRGRLGSESRDAFIPYLHKHLFNYTKGHDPTWTDPNESLYPVE